MEQKTSLIVHLCPQPEWEQAQKAGEFRDASLEQSGFIHCSRPDQIFKVANHYYRGVQDALLLWIDPGRLKAEIRWEQSDGDVFPHVYGPINLDAVVEVRPIVPDSDGIFRK